MVRGACLPGNTSEITGLDFLEHSPLSASICLTGKSISLDTRKPEFAFAPAAVSSYGARAVNAVRQVLLRCEGAFAASQARRLRRGDASLAAGLGVNDAACHRYQGAHGGQDFQRKSTVHVCVLRLSGNGRERASAATFDIGMTRPERDKSIKKRHTARDGIHIAHPSPRAGRAPLHGSLPSTAWRLLHDGSGAWGSGAPRMHTPEPMIKEQPWQPSRNEMWRFWPSMASSR